jgi:signal transduction histidine kinase
MTSILLDNAINYAPESGFVTVSLARRQNSFELRVSDTGIGIPEHAIPRIFDRFYRVEESRTENAESNGLGLAIAKWVVEAHRSTIDVASKPGQGSTFTVFISQVGQAEHTDAAYAPLS